MPYYEWRAMGKDRGKKSESDKPEAEGAAELVDEQDDAPIHGQPVCPNCGWRNTRPSHTRTLLDTVLRTLAFRPYRCRSCGNRFRVIRRSSQA